MGPTNREIGLILSGSFAATTAAGAAPSSNNERAAPSTLTSCNFASRFRCSVGSTFGSISVFPMAGRNSFVFLPKPCLVARLERPGRALVFGAKTGGAVAEADFPDAPESPELLLEIKK